MSASSTPILSPCARSARARLQAVVDLPTPPLPDATAMTCVTPGMACALGEGALAGRPGVGAGVVRGGGRGAGRGGGGRGPHNRPLDAGKISARGSPPLPHLLHGGGFAGSMA